MAVEVEVREVAHIAIGTLSDRVARQRAHPRAARSPDAGTSAAVGVGGAREGASAAIGGAFGTHAKPWPTGRVAGTQEARSADGDHVGGIAAEHARIRVATAKIKAPADRPGGTLVVGGAAGDAHASDGADVEAQPRSAIQSRSARRSRGRALVAHAQKRRGEEGPHAKAVTRSNGHGTRG